MLLCGELDEPALGYQYGRAGLAINNRLDDLALRARVIYVYARFVHHWSNHWASLTPWFRKGIEAGYPSGDLLYLAYSAQDCVIWDPTLDLETAQRLHAENLEVVRAQDELIKSAMSLPQLVRFYIVAFLTLAIHYPQMGATEQAATRERLERDLARMRRWADNCEANFRHLQYLMEAELARLDGAREAALERFDAAIDTARKSGFLRDEATACEWAARHLLALGRRA